MTFTIIIAGVLVFYFVIWFFDSFFKSCMHYPYYAFLEGTGLKISLLNFSWKTTAFNRLLFRWGKKGSHFLKKWYTVGYVFSLFVFLPFSVWVLTSTVVTNLWTPEKAATATEVKTVIPGINVPSGDLWAYFIALAISSTFHELGHAIAAVQEDVQILTVGFYVFFIVPIAFVELSTDHLNSLSVKSRLRIYCAGVWHNVACGVVAFLLFFSVSYIFRFGYIVGNGVRVVNFKPQSPLNGNRGLEFGDQITSINNCKVRDLKDWYSCIFSTTADRFGLCVTSEFVSDNDEIVVVSYKDNDLVDCCRPEDEQSLCFEYIEPKHGDASLAPQYSCLKPRNIVKERFVKCSKDNMCPNNDHCLKPLLGNGTHLFVIERMGYESVFYIGSPYDLSYTVTVDHYIPKYEMFTVFSPQSVEKMLEYIFMFSIGIGIVNIVPCFFTDGHHIARNVIQYLAMRYSKDKEFVNITTFSVVLLGTLAMIPCLSYIFVKTIINAF